MSCPNCERLHTELAELRLEYAALSVEMMHARERFAEQADLTRQTDEAYKVALAMVRAYKAAHGPLPQVALSGLPMDEAQASKARQP